MINTNLEDKTIEQKTFLWIKWKNVFNFKEDWIDYKLNDGQVKANDFIYYTSIYKNKNQKEVNSKQLYYLLVWILFSFLAITIGWIFNLLFWIIFLFLYYKTKEKYIVISAYPMDIFINDDKNKKAILDEIDKRILNIEKKQKCVFSYYNSKQQEQEKFLNLLNEKIITKEEYEEIINEIDLLDKDWKFAKNNNEAYMPPIEYIWNEYEEESEIIKLLLKEKWLDKQFRFTKIVYEKKSLPGWISSISWELIFDDWEKYSFWLDWDKNALNPNDNNLWYYTLWDSKDILDNYWRNFFKKLS